MKKINLEEILNKHSDVKDSYPTFGIIDAMKDACKQALELAAENAVTVHRFDGAHGCEFYTEKDSILNTINQIE